MSVNRASSELPYLLLSIRPTYANKIFEGTKTVELRRSFPRSYANRFVILYVSSPVKAILGAFQIGRIVEDNPTALWGTVRDDAGVTKREFLNYYAGVSTGFAIFIEKVCQFEKSVSLNSLRARLDDFDPPQNFRYLHRSHIDKLDLPTL